MYLWVRRPLLDHIALLLVAVWVVLGLRNDLPLILTEVTEESRRAFFQLLATLAGTTAGLTLTSVSIMLNLIRTPLSAVDRLIEADEKRRVGDVFLAVLPKLVLALIFSLLTLVLEPGTGTKETPLWVPEALSLWFAVAALSGMARVVWVLRRLLSLA